MKPNRLHRRPAKSAGVDQISESDLNQQSRAEQSEATLPIMLRVFDRTTTLKIVCLTDKTWIRLERCKQTPPRTYLSPGRIGYRAIDILRWLDARREVAA
jgi:hypothetical protein